MLLALDFLKWDLIAGIIDSSSLTCGSYRLDSSSAFVIREMFLVYCA